MSKALIIALCFWSCISLAQDTQTDPEGQADLQGQEQAIDTSVLREVGSEFHNSIKLLQNRFRIDYQVEEVTLIFFRKFGSAPIVLVKPDGSKLFQGDADDDELSWYDSTTYDMIKMKNPTPGPWQAVGQILPGSRVMVLSDLQLHAEPLPDIIFSGEVLKQTAYLTNGGEPINYTEFRDVVGLDMKLISTNNPNFDNFGADEQTIATFEDNGRGMDEAPLDGTFTGQFNLSVASGEWTPVFIVSTPMFTREQVDPPLRLFPNPVKIEVIQDPGDDGYHKLVIDVERELVDINTLLIDGKVRFPNGDVQNFSLTEESPEAREHQIINFEYGVYRIKLTAYGNTSGGRDFILDVPEYTFLAEAPELAVEEPAAIPAEEMTGEGDVAGEGAELAMPDESEMMALEEQEESMSTATVISLVAGINLFLFTVGGLIIWLIMRDKSSKAPKAESQVEAVEVSKPSLMEKLKGMLPSKKPKEEKAKKEDTPEMDDAGMLDLSLPDD